MMKKLNLRKGYHGAATVEFALVLPLLLLLTMGAIRYGHLFVKKQQITNAARQGARTMVLPDATEAEVMDAINALLLSDNMDPAVRVSLNFDLSSNTNNKVMLGAGQLDADDNVVLTANGTVDWVEADFSERAKTPIMVRIIIPSANVDVLHIPLFTDLEPNNWNLGAEVAMAKEGF